MGRPPSPRLLCQQAIPASSPAFMPQLQLDDARAFTPDSHRIDAESPRRSGARGRRSRPRKRARAIAWCPACGRYGAHASSEPMFASRRPSLVISVHMVTVPSLVAVGQLSPNGDGRPCCGSQGHRHGARVPVNYITIYHFAPNKSVLTHQPTFDERVATCVTTADVRAVAITIDGILRRWAGQFYAAKETATVRVAHCVLAIMPRLNAAGPWATRAIRSERMLRWISDVPPPMRRPKDSR